jgi:hypothetical protein
VGRGDQFICPEGQCPFVEPEFGIGTLHIRINLGDMLKALFTNLGAETIEGGRDTFAFAVVRRDVKVRPPV